MYALLDRKLKQFGQLVVERNDESIRRSLLDSIRNSKSLLEQHPEDFDLYCVGSFDQDSGDLIGNSLRLVVNLRDVLEAYAAGEATLGRRE